MGLYPATFVAQLKARGIVWIANVSTVAEARAAEEAGADVIAAQGMEAGGHRGCFDAASAERTLVGLFALVPAMVDAVRVPVVATGGIADVRGVAAALCWGHRPCRSARDSCAARKPASIRPGPTRSGELRRSGRCSPAHSAAAPGAALPRIMCAPPSAGAPAPAPYPVQRMLTQPMRDMANREGDVERMQAWAGQSAALARALPAGELTQKLWREAQALLA